VLLLIDAILMSWPFSTDFVELEVLTEQMSDIVARSHLRATQIQIAFLTAGAAEKRVELTNLVFQIYKDEKKEMERYKKQKEREEKRSKASAGILAAPDNTRSSLSELMAMHHRPRDRPFDESGLSEALDDFLARAGGMEHRSRLLGEVDDLASEAVRMWACPRCTFMNEGGRLCAMCGSRR
jgi:rubrerythrin